MKLSVLDQSVARLGFGEDEALRDTLALAQHCEALGYERFWVSEHHSLPTIVGSAPEVLLAAIAARTQRIRLGSAGVMLPHYAALKVAEQFRVLDALAPGRIDLGVGRAPGGDQRTAFALNPHASHGAEDFPRQVRDLQAWTLGLRHGGIVAHPRPPDDAGLERAPQIWILGSSDYGARLAAALGLPYAYAWFFSDGEGAEQALTLYHQLYQPSPRHPRPQATLCVWALVAENAEQAHFHALSRDRWRLDRERGRLGPLRPAADIAAEGFSPAELERLAPLRAKAFVGAPDQVAQQLQALAQRFGLDELVVNTWAHDRAVRRQSYSLLAQALQLGEAKQPS